MKGSLKETIILKSFNMILSNDLPLYIHAFLIGNRANILKALGRHSQVHKYQPMATIMAFEGDALLWYQWENKK